MSISRHELSKFNQNSVRQIISNNSIFVCEFPLNNGFKLHLYSISNYFIEELIDASGAVIEVKPVNTNYIASLYCKGLDLQ